jgi:hypothetical protein
MNQTEIDELRRLASVSREPRHGIGCIASDCALASAARNALPRLLAALEEAQAKLAKVQDAMETWFVDGDDTKLVTGLDMALAARAS